MDIYLMYHKVSNKKNKLKVYLHEHANPGEFEKM